MKKCTSFEEQKGRRYIRGNFYFGIIVFSCLLSTNLCLRFLSVCFAREIKSFYQSSLGNEVDFRDIMSVSQISWLKIKILKTETPFCRWKSSDNNDFNIFLSLENPYTFLLVKEKTWRHIFNTNSELLQNGTEKQIMPSKATINWLFSDIWCHLFIACFDSKVGIFQQTVLRVYYTWSINISLFQNDKKAIRR